jgi:hypothetical protein
MNKLGNGLTSEQDLPSSGCSDKEGCKKKGISAKDIAKNPAMAKMFILAAKKFKEVQERERLEAAAEQTDAVAK